MSESRIEAATEGEATDKDSEVQQNSFWDSDQDEEQPLTQSSPALLEPELPDQRRCCNNTPAALLTVLPLQAVYSFIWDSGMRCMAVSAAIQALSTLLVKLTNEQVPVFEIVVVRSAICMLCTLIIARMQGIGNIFGSIKYLVPMFVRGLAGALSMSVYYYAVFKLSLSDMVTLFYTHPAMIVLLAWLVRGEVVRWPGLVGILASLIGTLTVSQPPFLLGGERWSLDHVHGVIAALLAALLAAIAFIAIRFIPKSEPSICVATWFHFMGIVTAGIPLAFGIPSWSVLPSLHDSLCVVGVGLCSFTSHLFIARSFQIEMAAKASAAGYLQVVFAYIFGLVFLGEGIELWSVIGSIVISLGVFGTSWPSKKAEDTLPVTVVKDAAIELPESDLTPSTEAKDQKPSS